MEEEKLSKFIEKEISYDATGGEECPKCHYVLKESYYWIDHKSSLAGNINIFLGFKSGSWDDSGTTGMIYNVIDGLYVEGKRKKDAKKLAREIYNEFYDN